jgi:hypothetical protein
VSCIAGKFCREGAIVGSSCDKGFACPTGSSRPQRCPEGYIANATELSLCTACPPGRFEQNRQQCLDCT